MTDAEYKEFILRIQVQNAWEKAMDTFYEQVDRITSAEVEITDEDRIAMVRHQIDDETADAYEYWIA